MTSIHYLLIAAGLLLAFGAGSAFGYVEAMQKRLNKEDEDCLEDEDMKDTQKLNP